MSPDNDADTKAALNTAVREGWVSADDVVEGIFILWPTVSRFYSECHTDEGRLKQRIRRAFEKTGWEAEEMQPLAELLYEKLSDSIMGMK